MRPLHRTLRTTLLTILLVAAAASAASAAELYLLGGGVKSFSPSETTYSWQLEYRQDLLKHLAAGVSYLNEGHIDRHHRDGYAPQLWLRTELADYRLTLAAGAGPYIYFDTQREFNAEGYKNDHGVKALVSLAAAWHYSNDFIFELRSNLVEGGGGFGTASVLAGVGYHFDPDLKPLVEKIAKEPKNEVTLFLGQTIVNSFGSQRSIAAGIEYRRKLWRHVDWTLSGLYEGDNRLVRRDGVMTQLWAAQQLVEGMFTVAAGGGAYFDLGHYDNPWHASRKTVSAILTLTGSYNFSPHWALRASWNRLLTSYDRDTDVILGGIGYRF